MAGATLRPTGEGEASASARVAQRERRTAGHL